MIDVSLRLGILHLLRDLREQLGVSVLFITHDVATARYVGRDGELYVIYRGQVIERGPADTVIQHPVNQGGLGLGGIGPVAEGFIGLLFGVGGIMLVAFWLGDRK